MFITISGIDGTGKSTLARALALRLSEEWARPVRLTSEPGGTYLGRGVRRLLLDLARGDESLAFAGSLSEPVDTRIEAPTPLTELLLFTAARAQHSVRIREWLAHDEIVICDRFSDCTWAYQGARGLRDDLVEMLDGAATGGLIPDVTFLLDMPVSLALARIARNGALDRIESSGVAFYEMVRARYRELARRFPERIMTLDANERPERLTERAWRAVQHIQVTCETRHIEGEKIMARLGRAKSSEDDIIALAYKWHAEGKLLMKSDMAKALHVSQIHVYRTLLNLYKEHPEMRPSEKQMRAEMARRMNAGRRAKGFPALQTQAAAGYPNLVKAREKLAAKRMAQQETQTAE